jgi:HpcH/HpaI aldolase/citrate lyase family
MKFLLITNSSEIAAFAVEAGVDRIFIDLETLGKQQRQGHLDTLISRHDMNDVARLRTVVPRGTLLVRVNPVHDGTADEVEQVVQGGADIIMLPMFRGPREVETFCNAVGGRARTCLLLETAGAMHSLKDCIAVPGVDEVHIGLNDLHLDLGLRFMFEPLADGLVDDMAAILRDARLPFGIGGVARVGEGLLPAEMILGEHARLGSTRAILSRTFHRQANSVAEIRGQMDFGLEVERLRDAHTVFLTSSEAGLSANRAAVARRIRDIASRLPPRRPG